MKRTIKRYKLAWVLAAALLMAGCNDFGEVVYSPERSRQMVTHQILHDPDTLGIPGSGPEVAGGP